MSLSENELLGTFEEQEEKWEHAQDASAVLLPQPLRYLPNVEEHTTKGQLHIVAIKMKDVDTRPTVGFSANVSHGEQQAKVDELSEILKHNSHIYLLVQGEKDVVSCMLETLGRSLQVPIVAPYAAFFPGNPYSPILKINPVNKAPSLSDLGIRTSTKVCFDVDRMDQYFVNFGSGIYSLDEIEVDLNEKLRQTEFRVKLMEFPGGRKQKLICFIDPTQLPYTLKEGDRFQIRFDGQFPSFETYSVCEEVDAMGSQFSSMEIYESCEDPEDPNQWSGCITGNVPRHPVGQIAAIISRPSNVDKDCDFQLQDDEVPKAMPWKIMANPNFDKLFKVHTFQPAKIAVVLDRSVTRQIIRAAGELVRNAEHKKELWKVIRNCGETTERVDLYQKDHRSTEDVLRVFDKMKHLNKQQRAILASLTDLPSMMVTVQGGPGCGKTYLESLMVMPLLQSPDKESGTRQQCLFVCDTNRSADATAIRVQSMANDIVKRKDGSEVVVIRVFSNKVENMIMRHSTDYVAHRPEESLPFEKEDENLLSEIAMHFKNRLLEYERRATTTKSGVPDRRVTDKTVSLAYRMLQRAGIIENGPWKNVDETEFPSLWSGLESYVAGSLTHEQKKSIKDEFEVLRRLTLQSADVVVGTPFCVSQHSVYSAFKPVVMLIDEAARLIEPLLWLPLAWYTAPSNENLLAIIQVGDHYQTPPTVTLPKDHVSYQQLQMSMMARLQQGNSVLQMLTKQYRMHRDIAHLVSEVFYHNTLETSSCTHHANNLVASKMRGFISKRFKKRTNLIALDLPGTKQSWKRKEKSVSNPAHVEFTTRLVKSILEQTKPPVSAQDILVLVPYRAQARLYDKALSDEHLKTPNLGFAGVKVDTIDRFQGGESPIVLFDFVVTHKVGFLQEPGRLCTALSRAKCAQFIIGNFKGMEMALDEDSSDMSFMGKVLRYLDKNKLIVRHKGAKGIVDYFVH